MKFVKNNDEWLYDITLCLDNKIIAYISGEITKDYYNLNINEPIFRINTLHIQEKYYEPMLYNILIKELINYAVFKNKFTYVITEISEKIEPFIENDFIKSNNVLVKIL